MKNENYEEFIKKFERKKTSDDCYTPDNIYEVVAEYVERKYGFKRENFVRPFYPDMEYRDYEYPPECVVVDNPPFSILSQIMDFYYSHKINYFLFAPGLTTFSSARSRGTAICTGADVTYANGAAVNTSFVTNLEANTLCRSDPELYAELNIANKENLKEIKKQHPKYSYPSEVLTAPMLEHLSKYGVRYSLGVNEGVHISALDDQRLSRKTIFGGGYLLTEKAAAEKAAAEKAAAEKAVCKMWKLSEREKKIIKNIGKDEVYEQMMIVVDPL